MYISEQNGNERASGERLERETEKWGEGDYFVGSRQPAYANSYCMLIDKFLYHEEDLSSRGGDLM